MMSKDANGKGNCGPKPDKRMGAKRQTGTDTKPKDMMKPVAGEIKKSKKDDY